VFLAGDAVHVMPPTGGFGGNRGVQDGYDVVSAQCPAPKQGAPTSNAPLRPAVERPA